MRDRVCEGIEKRIEWLFEKSYLAPFLSAVGVAIAVLIIFFPFSSLSDDYRKPEFTVWFLLILMSAAVYSVTAISQSGQVVSLFIKYWRDSNVWSPLLISLVTLVGFGFLYAVVFLVPWRLGLIPDFENHEPSSTRTTAIVIIGGLATLPAAIGISLVPAYLRMSHNNLGNDLIHEHIDSYLKFRGDLQWSLLILGVMIGFATAAIGALRKLRDATCLELEQVECIVRPLDVLYLGAYFTVVLLVFYLPASLTILAIGQRIRDTLCPLPSPISGSWSEDFSRRKNLEELLHLQIVSPHTLQIAGGILAPIVSGIIVFALERT